MADAKTDITSVSQTWSNKEQGSDHTSHVGKISGVLLVILGVVGVAFGAIIFFQGAYLPELGLWSGVFTFCCGVVGLMVFFDPQTTLKPYTASCFMLALLEISTIWVVQVSNARTEGWCIAVGNLTNQSKPLPDYFETEVCDEGNTNFILTCHLVVTVVSALALVTAIIVSVYGITRMVKDLKKMFPDEETKNTRVTKSAGYGFSDPRDRPAGLQDYRRRNTNDDLDFDDLPNSEQMDFSDRVHMHSLREDRSDALNRGVANMANDNM